MNDIEKDWEFKLSWRGGNKEHDDKEKIELPNNDGKNQSWG